ncbi:hypothetical protein E2320_011772 [Naja naja]|nr:hypothetical protein E2320_011772 [Naja naja]
MLKHGHSLAQWARCPRQVVPLTFARICAACIRLLVSKARWEEEKRDDGVKWHKLHHKGPYFAPPYEPLPSSVKFYYNGRPMKLSRAAEEVATFFAKMLDHDYARKKIFRDNFFCDWMQGEKDWQKYEVARRLKTLIHRIRRQYRADWKSKELKKRQISVALYFIDKTADTVGCCSLRVEHIALHSRQGGKENVVEFDFLGKDCIRYYNKVSVEKQVFKNLKLFMEEKEPGDNLFDKLSIDARKDQLADAKARLRKARAELKCKKEAKSKACKRFDVPIEKVYNKTQREKFAWAIAMAEEDFVF